MPVVLGIATVLGIIGVISAFGLFYLGERVFDLDRAHIQTLMYLKLSVAGHLTIFLTRTRGPFWSIRPARILWVAVLGTQMLATLIAVYGVFMTPLGWGWALFVWGYALAWFLVNDCVKLLAYRIFDPITAAAQPEAKAAPQPEASDRLRIGAIEDHQGARHELPANASWPLRRRDRAAPQKVPLDQDCSSRCAKTNFSRLLRCTLSFRDGSISVVSSAL